MTIPTTGQAANAEFRFGQLRDHMLDGIRYWVEAVIKLPCMCGYYMTVTLRVGQITAENTYESFLDPASHASNEHLPRIRSWMVVACEGCGAIKQLLPETAAYAGNHPEIKRTASEQILRNPASQDIGQ